MEVIKEPNKLIYRFYEEQNEEENLCEIVVKTSNKKKAQLVKINFFHNSLVKYWKMFLDDLHNKKYNYLYFLLKENMLYLNELLNAYKKLGFKSHFKKIPNYIYYKNDQVYRIMYLFMNI